MSTRPSSLSISAKAPTTPRSGEASTSSRRARRPVASTPAAERPASRHSRRAARHPRHGPPDRRRWPFRDHHRRPSPQQLDLSGRTARSSRRQLAEGLGVDDSLHRLTGQEGGAAAGDQRAQLSDRGIGQPGDVVREGQVGRGQQADRPDRAVPSARRPGRLRPAGRPARHARERRGRRARHARRSRAGRQASSTRVGPRRRCCRARVQWAVERHDVRAGEKLVERYLLDTGRRYRWIEGDDAAEERRAHAHDLSADSTERRGRACTPTAGASAAARSSPPTACRR